VKTEQRILNYVLSIGVIVSLCVGPCVGSLLWVLPCLPPFLGSSLLDCDVEGHAEGWSGLLPKLIIGLQSGFSFLAWTYTAMIGVVYFYFVFTIAVVNNSNHLKYIQE